MDFIPQGAGPLLIQNGAGAASSYPLETFETSSLDLTKPLLGLEIIPARPFYFAFLVAATWVTEIILGTQTSPPTVQAGSDLLHSNFIASTSASPSTASINAASLPALIPGPGGLIGPTVRKLVNAPVFLDITAGATGTGNFALQARLAVHVAWLAPTT